MGIGIGADVSCGTRVIGVHTHACAYAHRGHTGAGEGTPYNIQMAAWGSGSDCECDREPFGNGVTLFSNPNRQ